MILFFSGTGNSRFAARELGKQLDDEVISLNTCMQEKKARKFTSDRPYVVVAPIYMSRMPLEVEEYLKMCSFSGNRNIWFVATCGGGMGSTGHYCRRIAEDRGLTYHGTDALVMPNNYVAFSDVISSEEAPEKAKQVLPDIARIAQQISRGEDLVADPKLTAMGWVSKGAGLFHGMLMRDKAFHTNDRCISCGQCEKICPMCDIRLQDGRPVWGGKCMQCMACISICPVKAIDYGKKTENRNRYYLK